MYSATASESAGMSVIAGECLAIAAVDELALLVAQRRAGAQKVRAVRASAKIGRVAR